MSVHVYALTTDFGWNGIQPITDVIDPAQLSREIEADATIARAPDSIMADEDADQVTITISPDLTAPEITALNAVVAAHVPTDPTPEDPTEGRSGIVIRPYVVGVGVRDLVYQKNDGTVDKGSATTVATSILVGFVEQLDVPAAGMASVRYLGDLDGFTGLVPGDIYILGKAAGSIVRETLTGDGNYPDQTPQSGHTSYKVGTAVTTSKLWVDISRGFTEF